MSNHLEAGNRPMKGNHGLRIGSCFSGIGGIELGLEAAGVGRTVYQVELNPFARAQLARHWPDVERHADIATVDPAQLPPADVICGGPPCQDTSVANARGNVTGTRAGLQGARTGLWSYMARIIEAQRPRWVVVENVARGWAKWLPGVRGDLHRLGYASLPVPLEARVVGAPHVRSRIFLLAHANGEPLRIDEQRMPGRRAGELRDGRAPVAVESRKLGGWDAQPSFHALDDGLPRGLGKHYWRAVGNAVVPQLAEVVGWMIRELEAAGVPLSAPEGF